MNPSIPISELVRMRTSRRTYLKEPFQNAVLENIRNKLSAIPFGPFGTDIEFSLISLFDVTNQKLKLGTYGFIQGASHFIAGQIIPSKNGFLDYGFALESLILEFTRLGLGTCWLGGTFNRGEFAKAIQLKEGFVIPAVTPVGYSTEKRGLGDRIIRLGAGSRNRLPWEKLFFKKEPSAPLVLGQDHPDRIILESVRLAPSASNNQPWRIAVDGSLFHFNIYRKPGYRQAFSLIDLQMIDMGIVMAHFDLVSRETGRNPVWEFLEGTLPMDDCEYVISVFLP